MVVKNQLEGGDHCQQRTIDPYDHKQILKQQKFSDHSECFFCFCVFKVWMLNIRILWCQTIQFLAFCEMGFGYAIHHEQGNTWWER